MQGKGAQALTVTEHELVLLPIRPSVCSTVLRRLIVDERLHGEGRRDRIQAVNDTSGCVCTRVEEVPKRVIPSIGDDGVSEEEHKEAHVLA